MKKRKLLALFLAIALLTACTAPSGPKGKTENENSGAEESEIINAGEDQTSEPPNDAGAEAETDKKENPYLLSALDERVPALQEHFSGIMKIGAAINTRDLSEELEIYDLLTKHYNVFVLENEMKPENVNPEPGVFTFDKPDVFVEFGEDTGVLLRGHTLVWHSQVPAWWFEGSGEDGRATRDELLSRMEEYITTVVTRYKGKIDSWDVVNEAFSDNFGLRGEEENSLWTTIIGDLDGDGSLSDYIEQAFYFAHAADPDAQLILNDYNLEGDPKKLNTLYQTVKAMLEKGVPIDGVGIQGHINLNWPAIDDFENAIETLASLKEYNPDFVVQITELDISIFDSSDNRTEKEMDLITQTQFAARYAELFEMFSRQAEAGNLEMVLFWGLHDGVSWRNSWPISGRTDAPLLFDRDQQTKAAFWAVVEPNQLAEIMEYWKES